jgi:Polyketide cyclase / dehydrase and lipid transport
MKFNRVRAGFSKEVVVAAADYWDVLLDWQGILKWMPAKGSPVPLVRVELEPGHVAGKVPCTRNCYFDTSGLPPGVAIPECVPETLLHIDPVARTIYYNMEGEGPFGMRNYLATTEVDELGPGLTRVTCSGRFDLPEGAPVDVVKSVIEGVYRSIIDDIPALVVRQKKSA